MILIVALLAETVPSAPSPKNTARVSSVASSSRSKAGSKGSELCDTSSRMPTVKRVGGLDCARASNTAFTIAGVNSLPAKP